MNTEGLQADARVFVAFLTRTDNPSVNEITHASAAVKHANENGVFAILRHICQPYGVVIGRNQAAREMFSAKIEGKPFTHLMFIDDDVSIPMDTIERLAKNGCDVVCGQVPSIQRINNLEVPYVQCMDLEGRWPHRWLEPHMLHEIKACGFGCMMIARNVLERIGFPWFVWPDDSATEKGRMSDDVHFCFRAREAGFRIYGDSMIRCGHCKNLDVASQIVEPWCMPHDVAWQGPKPAGALDELPAYATHAPALMSIPKHHKIRHITEFGGGCWSTPLFCNRTAFPDAEKITTYESDDDWAQKIVRMLHGEQRLDVIRKDLQAMREAPINGADLVLVDCAYDTIDPVTCGTREIVLVRQASSGCIAVLHDSERMPASLWEEFAHVKHVDAGEGLPRTTIVSQSIPVEDIEVRPIGGLTLKRLTRNV